MPPNVVFCYFASPSAENVFLFLFAVDALLTGVSLFGIFFLLE